MTSPKGLLEGFSKLIELFKKNPTNKLIITRYLQLVSDLEDLQAMSHQLEPLLDQSVGLPIDLKQNVATRLWSIDPSNTSALQTLSSVYEQAGDVKASLIFQRKLERQTDDYSSPFALSKLPVSEVAFEPELKESSAKEAQPPSAVELARDESRKEPLVSVLDEIQHSVSDEEPKFASIDLFRGSQPNSEDANTSEPISSAGIVSPDNQIERYEIPTLEISSLNFAVDTHEEATKMVDLDFVERNPQPTPDYEIEVVPAIVLQPPQKVDTPIEEKEHAKNKHHPLAPRAEVTERVPTRITSLVEPPADLNLRELALGQNWERLASLRGIEGLLEPLIEAWGGGMQALC